MVGDPAELINAQGRDAKCLAARSWRAADESEWKYTDHLSYWPQKVYGLTVDCWAGRPGLSCKALDRHFAPHDNTELIANFPNEVTPAHMIAKWLRNRGAPPPPPHAYGESSWEDDKPAHWGAPTAGPPEAATSSPPPFTAVLDQTGGSAARTDDPNGIDNAPSDLVSYVTGPSVSQAPSVITGESIAQAFHWVVQAEAFRQR